MNEAYPDLEIYIKRVDPKEILNWLKDRFEQYGSTLKNTEIKSSTLLCTFMKDGRNASCAIVDKAAKGGYVSVWFKENQTPWRTDRDFALEAFEFFKQEVRCSTGPWEDTSEKDASSSDNSDSDEESSSSIELSNDDDDNNDNDRGGWIRFTDEGEKIINWLT